MKKRAAVERRMQGAPSPIAMATVMHQMVLPMIVGAEATKKGLMSFVHQMGMIALQELFAIEASALAGPKGRRNADRTHHHWGATKTALPFGGRHISVERPRVRRKGGGEEPLPSIEEFRRADPLSARVAEQIVLGVSTRGYARSLEPIADDVIARGTSKSNASRALVDKTTEKVAEFMTRRLDEVDLVAMFLDGIEIAGKAAIIALGVISDGTKVPLGLWLGATENHTVATELVQDMIARGLRVDEPTLFVIDGGKAIHKALRDVFGDLAVIQRCQVHKLRNVRDHLPESRRAHVARQMRDAYKSKSASVAKKKLQQLATWLAANGEDAAAESLREGLDETLTILRLGLSPTLVRTFSTTNAIENLNSSLRRVCRNVKRWRGDHMIRRWIALGIGEAQRKFRRVKGHQQMPVLIAALRPAKEVPVDSKRKVA
jgi:putative transposase